MEDSKILALYHQRNESAISLTAEKYGGYCSKIARNILRNEQDTEECVNSVYLKIWESIPPEKPKIFPAFLAKLTRNAAIDLYRKNCSGKRGNGEIPLIYEELENCVSGNDTPENAAVQREMLAAINKFLSKQPKKTRIIFVLRYCFCQSINEIAVRFDMSENNVSVNLSRTRRRLYEYLKREGYEL